MSGDHSERSEKGLTHRGPAHSSPYPVSRLAPTMELVDLAREVAAADSLISVTATAKLKVIADQIRALQTEARKVLSETKLNQDLHRVVCTFKRLPGKIYHVYEREDGTRYFSMLSPQEWGDSPPHRFMASYRLESDMSWTPADMLDVPDDTHQLVAKLLEDSR